MPRSLRHWASNVSSFPGSTRGSDSSSWGELYKQVAVSPLESFVSIVLESREICFSNIILISHNPWIIVYSYLRKWWNDDTLHGDHLKPFSECLKSLIMNPSSQRHFSAPGPPRYVGGGDPSCTAPNLEKWKSYSPAVCTRGVLYTVLSLPIKELLDSRSL